MSDSGNENESRRRIGDRFVVGEPLGAGGMGSIYHGEDERLGQPVAIKIMKRALADDPIARERFRREARSLAMLKHPSIVAVLDAGEADGDLYTVMELVTGETLEHVLAKEGALSFERAAPLFDQLLAALEVCHASEVVHRDLKPSNVMVSSGLHVKLIDFGLARLENRPNEKLTETGTVQGTASYMAPEQCRGEEIGPPCDVYAAGVLFYEVLAGAPPFRGNDSATLMAQHLFAEPPALRDAAPLLSAGVVATVHSALAKKPQDRPTASALRAALAAAASGTDPEARAAHAADHRRDVSGLSRADRAIGTRATDAAAQPAVAGHVIVWMSAGDRSAALLGCLGTAEISASLAASEDVPPLSEGLAIVISAREGLERVRRLRATSPKLPIIVVDVMGPGGTTDVIRAGANDMLLAESPDADLAPKLRRLLAKRSRG